MNSNPYRFRTHQKNQKKKHYDYNKRFSTENNNDDNIINNINNNINFRNNNRLRASDNNLHNNYDIHINDDLNENLKIDDVKNDINKQNNIIYRNHNIQNEIQAKKGINEMMMNKRKFSTINREEEEENNRNRNELLNNNNHLKINKANNQNKILYNRNINKDREINSNRKENLPQPPNDIKSDENKNEIIFQRSPQNFHRKKKDFTDEPNNKIQKKYGNILNQTPVKREENINKIVNRIKMRNEKKAKKKKEYIKE